MSIRKVGNGHEMHVCLFVKDDFGYNCRLQTKNSFGHEIPLLLEYYVKKPLHTYTNHSAPRRVLCLDPYYLILA